MFVNKIENDIKPCTKVGAELVACMLLFRAHHLVLDAEKQQQSREVNSIFPSFRGLPKNLFLLNVF